MGKAGASNQPDVRVVARLFTLQSACLSAAAFISVGILSAWVLPDVRFALPRGWSLMKANTALCVALAVVSFGATPFKPGTWRRAAGQVCAGIVLLLAGSALVEHGLGYQWGIDTLLAADHGAGAPGLMSLQTAWFLMILGLLLWFEHCPLCLTNQFPDAVTSVLVLLTLTIFAGYVFKASSLFGQSEVTRTSPQTLACMGLLTCAAVVRRTRDGFFSVFAGVGIGSQTLRFCVPVFLLAPFVLDGAGLLSMSEGWLSAPYAVALTTSLGSVFLFMVNIFLARKTNDLERELRDLSVTDALTQLHNRRGFYLLGEQALLVAQREVTPLTVLFFDVDGLKTINDTAGHDAGSRLLADVAGLLRGCFRSSDVVARVGGDEFAAVIRGPILDLATLLDRLHEATATANGTWNRPYKISYSTGQATIKPGDTESFGDMVGRADAAMYERKRLRKTMRECDLIPAPWRPELKKTEVDTVAS